MAQERARHTKQVSVWREQRRDAQAINASDLVHQRTSPQAYLDIYPECPPNRYRSTVPPSLLLNPSSNNHRFPFPFFYSSNTTPKPPHFPADTTPSLPSSRPYVHTYSRPETLPINSPLPLHHVCLFCFLRSFLSLSKPGVGRPRRVVRCFESSAIGSCSNNRRERLLIGLGGP